MAQVFVPPEPAQRALLSQRYAVPKGLDSVMAICTLGWPAPKFEPHDQTDAKQRNPCPVRAYE